MRNSLFFYRIFKWNGELYSTSEHQTQTVSIKAIPYYAWCNRGEGEMMVWINEK
ncbi:hypothetical protein [Neobacillus niacini]|uniref:hypothetical protein n=1 Tax=Neobacillus niacini TaxID=86668 RepID=UPI003B5890B9